MDYNLIFFVNTENKTSFNYVYLVQVLRFIYDLDNVPILSEIWNEGGIQDRMIGSRLSMTVWTTKYSKNLKNNNVTHSYLFFIYTVFENWKEY